MSSANSAMMSKVDHEREDVLRAELARLCWLAIHDKPQGSEGERLLQARLAAARGTGTSTPIGGSHSPIITTTDPTDPGRR